MRTIDVSTEPELDRVAEEVRSSGEARILRRDGEDLALIVPLPPAARRRRRREGNQADDHASVASAGGWADVDADRFLADIYESRQAPPRPAVER